MTRAVLMCRPDHFGIEYEINPWMHVAVPGRPSAGGSAMGGAASHLRGPRASRSSWPTPVSGLPDMVFTANAAVLWDGRAVLSNFHHRERRGEEPHWRRELERLHFEVHELPRSLSFEGAGDALFVGDRLFCGYGFRTDRESHRPVARILEVEVVSLELVDPRFYHLDTCFCPLDANDRARRTGRLLAGVGRSSSVNWSRTSSRSRSRSPPDSPATRCRSGIAVVSSLTIAQLAGAVAGGRVHDHADADGGVPQGGRRRALPLPPAWPGGPNGPSPRNAQGSSNNL